MQLVKIATAARILDCSKAHVRKLIDAEILVSVMEGGIRKITRSSLDKYLASLKSERQG